MWYRIADADQLAAIMADGHGHSMGYAVPEGMLADHWRDHIRREAATLLPTPFREVVEATEAPFAQAIRDLICPEMSLGRIAILGDAASIVRPQTAAGTAKAAANALTLANVLQRWTGELPAALARWSIDQIELSQALRSRGIAAGNAMLFNRI